jgi:Ribosomal protein L9, N-terminal domain
MRSQRVWAAAPCASPVVLSGIYTLQEVCGMSDFTVVRLLQNPLGQKAPAGHRGDIVRVSDGRASLYLFPWEFEGADEVRLRWLLAQKATR